MPLFRACILVVAALALAACSSRFAASIHDSGGDPVRPSLSDTAYTTRDDQTLPFSAWQAEGAPQAVVVAVHGMNDYRRAFALTGPWLAARGVTLYAYDQRGHGGAPDFGRWAGHEVMRRDLVDFLTMVGARHPGVPLYLLGESMGASIAVLGAADPAAPRLAGVILSAPAIRPLHAMPVYQRVIGSIAGVVAPGLTVPMAPTTASTATDNRTLLAQMAEDPLIPRRIRVDMLIGIGDAMAEAARSMDRVRAPLLMLLGEKDTVLPSGAGDAMLVYAKGVLPDVATRIYPQGHHLLLRDEAAEQVYADILAWMKTKGRPEILTAETAPPSEEEAI